MIGIGLGLQLAARVSDGLGPVLNSQTDYPSEWVRSSGEWTINATSFVSAGAGAGDHIRLDMSQFGFVVSDVVRLDFDISALAAGNMQISFSTGATNGGTYSTAGSHTVTGTLTGNTTFYLKSHLFDATLENVRVRRG